MMKKLFLCLAANVMTFFVVTVSATDLSAVYQQALKNDPTFKAANADWLAKRETLPIARAALLPQISAVGSIGQANNTVERPTTVNYGDNTATYSLSLTQPIFNFANWASLRGASSTVQQAEADFFSAAQDLMYRSAAAYFAVLQAQDVLRYTTEQKKAIGEQLRQQKQRYAVGLIPVTDVNETQASFDDVASQEITAQNNLRTQEEKLQEITGIKNLELKHFRSAVPLVNPAPEDIEQWVHSAEQQNYSLLAARNAALAAREAVMTQAGGHFPTLNATGGYSYAYDSNYSGNGAFGRTRSATMGLALTVPIFSGGATGALTQQAGYRYQQAIANQEKAHRTVVSETRQAYLGVISGISKVKADRQAVVSKRSALQSMQNSYSAGLRTMFEVLQAQSQLYNAEKDYAKDQYSYLLSTLALKQKIGALSLADIEKINRWLWDGAGVSGKIKEQDSVSVETDAELAKHSTASIKYKDKQAMKRGNTKEKHGQHKNTEVQRGEINGHDKKGSKKQKEIAVVTHKQKGAVSKDDGNVNKNDVVSVNQGE